MDCTDCVERLYAFLDRELDPAEIAEVRTHLGHCAPCEGEFVIEEVAEGFSFEEVQALTDMQVKIAARAK